MTGSLKRICSKCGTKYEIHIGCPCSVKKEDQNNDKKIWRSNNKDTIRFFNSSRWKKLRMVIIQRDNGHCQRCLIKWKRINSTSLQAHHILSRENHPEMKWEESNLVTLCKTCNIQLGTKDKLDFDFTVPEIQDFNL